MLNRIFIIITVVIICLTSAYAEDELFFQVTSDSVVVIDSITTSSDSIGTKTDIDSVVYSSASDSIVFFIKKKKMNIYGTGDLRYKETNLKSGQIFVDFATNNVEAFAKNKDSAGQELKETPILLDKGEEYRGTRMKYNFKTTRGYITYAATKNDETSYSGAKINKVDKTTFFIQNGIYTTCDAEEPHYCFFGNEMKVVQKEQLIGKWVWLTFGNVPFPIPLPFVVVPLQSGRRSGILPPAYGERQGFGKYFSRFGYFWAISDYMDLLTTADYYTKGGYSLQGRYRYALRYNFTGSIEGSFSDLHSGELTDPDRLEQKDWRIRIIHNQNIDPTSRADLNLEFMSGGYFQQNTTNYDQLLRREINSNASYFKSWEEAGTSLSLNYSRRQDLDNGNINEVLPSLNITKAQFYPFRGKGSAADQRWYELIGISYSGQFLNKRDKQEGQLKIRGGVSHSASIGASPKIGYLNLSPSFSYREYWYNKRIVRYSVPSFNGNDSVITEDKKEYNFVRTFSFGAGTSTKLYGIFQPQTAGIAAIRHIISPSVSYNYTPDFSTPGWGYYDTYTDVKGNIVKYNKFEREIFGGAGSRESQSLGFRVDNNFEMKTMVDPTDTTSKEQKYQLLNLSGSFNYDFTADSMRFSDIQVNYHTQVGSFMSLQGSTIYSLYDYDRNTGRVINKTLLSSGNGFLRMTSFNFSVSLSFSGERKAGSSDSTQAEQIFPNENRFYRGMYDIPEVDFAIPWSVSLNYNYSFNKYNPLNPSKYSNLSGNINFSVTPLWKLTLTGSYDITAKEFAAPQLTVSRDLHCWLMNFTWNPLGAYTGYRLEIRVKAPQLQDLKITKSDSFFSGRR